MKSVYVNFKSIQDILEFHSLIDHCDEKVYVGDSQNEVDGKSLLGVMAMSVKQPMLVTIESDYNYELEQYLTQRFA